MISRRLRFAVVSILAPIAIIAAPSAPSLSTPADIAKNQTTSPTLSWTAVSGATSYHLQVSSTADFSSTVFDQSGITGTSQAVSGLAASIINIGTPVNYDNTGGFFNDNQRTMIRKGATTTYRSFEGFNDVMYEGTITNPVASNLGNYGWSWNGITGHELYWVMAAYNPGGDTLLGDIHMEDNGQTEYPRGLALSTNFGQSWTYLGDHIHPNPITRNAGGGIFVIVNGYFYNYYNNGGLKVARAPVDSVMMAARQLKVTQWMTYNNGNWDIPALSSTAGTTTFPGDAHGGGTVVKSTGTILVAPLTAGSTALTFYASTDGLTAYQSFPLPGGLGSAYYPSFAGPASSGSRTDHFEVGDSFYVFWNHAGSGGYNDNHFYRAAIAAYPKNYYWRVSASDASGAGAWSTARVFTTRATIQSGAVVDVERSPARLSSRRDIAVRLQRVNGRLTVTSAVPANLGPATISIHDLRGRSLVTVTNARVESRAVSADAGTVNLAAGKYFVRVRANGFHETAGVILGR